MKRKFLFVIGLVLMIIVSLSYIYIENSDKNELKNDYCLTIEEKNLLQEGDIIFRYGFGIVSDAIVKYLNSDYPVSHCGIIVKDSLNKWAVIHTVSNALSKMDGMQKDNLNVFVKGSHKNSVIIARYNCENDTLRKKIAEKANYYLSKQIPFDHHFDCEDTNAFFCTEFIKIVFKTAVDIDIYESSNEKEKNCMDFSPLLNSEKFIIVLNHGRKFLR
jgi:hypothetical protein